MCPGQVGGEKEAIVTSGEEASPVPAILRRLRAEPSRTWSVVMTVFGDVVVPRGGSVAARTLVEVFAGMEVGGGAVRTALSRLSGDGWLTAEKVGRHSFYRLTEKGRAAFAPATDRIYGPPHREWDGRLQLLLPSPAADRDAAREALLGAGFGSAPPGVWIAPASIPPPRTGMLRLEATADPDTGRALAQLAWPLAATADAYRRFLGAFASLRTWADTRPDGVHALVARVLLIHEYRRAVLRDPHLPSALMPPDWPGAEAWRLCRDVYPALLPGSEAWLDAHASDEHGPLPPAGPELRRRFSGVTGIP
jgi:phenylacetic acid degradation operon negative regulatory protein